MTNATACLIEKVIFFSPVIGYAVVLARPIENIKQWQRFYLAVDCLFLYYRWKVVRVKFFSIFILSVFWKTSQIHQKKILENSSNLLWQLNVRIMQK